MTGEPDSVTLALEARYANYFQIGHNAFEFLLEFGQASADKQPLVHTRVFAGPAYAKLFSAMLVQSIGQFEKKFGPIPEPDAFDTKE